MRFLFILFILLSCVAASHADHTKFTLNWGVARFSRAEFGDSSKIDRPFFSLNVYQKHRKVDFWGSVMFLGGSLQRTQLSEAVGSYGLTYHLSRSFDLSFGHFSAHPLFAAPFAGDYLWMTYKPN